MPHKIKNVILYDVDEVAIVLNHHRNTILNKIAANEILATKFKPRESYWVDREELERLCGEYNLPPDMIEYRLGLKAPKTGNPINKKMSV